VFEAQGPSGWWEVEIPKHDPSPNLRPIKVKADHVDKGMLVVAAGKNKKVRRVPLDPELVREFRLRIGGHVPLNQPGSFNRGVRDLSGIDSFHVHRCRHHYAIDWLGRGGNLKALSLSLGHGSISVTKRYARIRMTSFGKKPAVLLQQVANCSKSVANCLRGITHRNRVSCSHQTREGVIEWFKMAVLKTELQPAHESGPRLVSSVVATRTSVWDGRDDGQERTPREVETSHRTSHVPYPRGSAQLPSSF
jgi:hypothetical protein